MTIERHPHANTPIEDSNKYITGKAFRNNVRNALVRLCRVKPLCAQSLEWGEVEVALRVT
jgi:hypothetical protein